MEGHIVVSILRTGNAVRRCVDRQVEQTGLECGGPHLRILGYLAHHTGEDLYQKDLEATFGLARSTVSGILGQLEAQGLIAREAVPDDARLKRVVLTQKALQQHQWIEARSAQLEETICRDFSPKEQAQFRDYLNRVLDNLGAPRCKTEHGCSGGCRE